MDQHRFDEALRPVSGAMRRFDEAYASEFHKDLPFLQPILSYLGVQQGKRLRPALFFLTQGLIARPDPETVDVAVLLELLHTATLVHDDVVDGSAERRGEKSLNAVWGDRVSVLVGDFLFARVLELGVHAGCEDILSVVSQVVSAMGRAELREALRDTDRLITVDAYYQHVRDKTAGLFGATCRFGGLAAGASEEDLERLERFGEHFGIAFQIRDDILDFSGHAETMGKPVGQDLSNGKVTLPLIVALERADASEREDILRKMTEEDGKALHDFVEAKGGVAGAQERARMFGERAMESLKAFPENEYRLSLERLVEFDLERVG